MVIDKNKTGKLVIYCWYGYENNEIELNLSSPEKSLRDFEKIFLKMNVGENLFINTTRVPEGSPHHIDNKFEVVDEQKNECNSMQIVITAEKQQEITLSIEEESLILEVPVYVKEYFLESFFHTIESAYYYDNYVPTIFLDDNGEIKKGKLYFWATDGHEIVFC
ncbi:MAG: hypothetical protein ACN4GM_08425 [Gammaproteobacteria bacterium]